MAFSPLQSRLVASIAATVLVATLYLLLFAPHIAYAEEIPVQVEPNPILDLLPDEPLREIDPSESAYQPDFALFDRSILGRAAEGVTPLHNNAVSKLNIEAGQVACYVLERSAVRNSTEGNFEDLETSQSQEEDSESRPQKRQSEQTRTIYISATTCLRPHQTDPDADDQIAPQLTLLAGREGDERCPRSTDDLPESHWIPFEEGLATLQVRSSEEVYISVMAPNVSEGFQDVYNFEVVASIDQFYHKYEAKALGRADLLWLDSDSSAALLTTQNLTANASETKEWMQADPPFQLFVENDNWKVFDGLRRSACAMRNVALIEANKDNNGRQHELVRTQMTTRGPGGLPKQQFYFEGLNGTSTYNAILFRSSSNDSISKRQDEGSEQGTAGGGGVVYEGIEFETLAGSTCKVITDLEFCSETQYAVPGSDKFNGTELAQVYDRYAETMYSHFKKIMMQIPCETDSTSAYSLVRDCDDCKNAYKKWLCTVAIPRCEDYTSTSGSAIVRNAGQSFPNGTMLSDEEIERFALYSYHNRSRNAFIDEEIAPGPYKEVLPCEDLCYEVVQSCPASMGFKCPRPGNPGFRSSYGRRNNQLDVVSCNAPGEARTRLGAATSIMPQRVLLAVLPSFTLVMTLLI